MTTTRTQSAPKEAGKDAGKDVGREAGDESGQAGAAGRRRPDSRRKLLAAARTLFVEKGFHDTRPQDISRAAEVGHGTFYLHFTDKRACFFAFVDEACAELDETVEEYVEGVEDFQDRVRRTLIAIFDFSDRHPGLLVAALADPGVIDAGSDGEQSTLLERWGRQWGEALQGAAENGKIVSDYDFAVIGQAVIGLVHQVTSLAFRRGVDRETVIENLTKFLVRALARP